MSLRTREDLTILPSPTSETVLTVAAFGKRGEKVGREAGDTIPELMWTLGLETQVFNLTYLF